MAELDVTKSIASDLTSAVKDTTIDPKSLDSATDLKETTWMNKDWPEYLGYYDTIPELASVTDAKATWTVGKGYKADPETTMILDAIRGNGSDTFNTILENMERTSEIGGDSYAHIIREDDRSLINLKPLNPEFMKHVVGSDGILIRFEQMSVIEGKKPKKFELDEIFYLPRNRVGDEIHGNTMCRRLAFIIKAKNEAMRIQKQIIQRHAKPRWIIKLDTDVPLEIAAEKAKWDRANEGGENMYVPMGSVEAELMAISPNAIINIQTWIDNLDAKFYEAANVPKIIVGGTGAFTDAAVKTGYLAFEQNIRERQLQLEEQVGIQLGIEIHLEMPASLAGGLLSDEAKDGTLQQQLNKPSEIQPTEVEVK